MWRSTGVYSSPIHSTAAAEDTNAERRSNDGRSRRSEVPRPDGYQQGTVIQMSNNPVRNTCVNGTEQWAVTTYNAKEAIIILILSTYAALVSYGKSNRRLLFIVLRPLAALDSLRKYVCLHPEIPLKTRSTVRNALLMGQLHIDDVKCFISWLVSFFFRSCVCKSWRGSVSRETARAIYALYSTQPDPTRTDRGDMKGSAVVPACPVVDAIISVSVGHLVIFIRNSHWSSLASARIYVMTAPCRTNGK